LRVRFVLFCHSIYSDWNNGNAHFLRGITRELLARGHEVRVYEPRCGWSRRHLARETGAYGAADFRHVLPGLEPVLYELETLDLGEALDGAEVVLVHEWNDPALVARLGRHRAATGRYLLFFHDTHHRSVSEPEAMVAYELDGYDGVLAFGEVIREIYLRQGWSRRAWTWHEAADVRLFQPAPGVSRQYDLVWIGNWADEERSVELHEFLLGPIRELRLTASLFGVRYPPAALTAIQASGGRYGGWLANHLVPEVFARAGLTMHVPRRPYVRMLPGIPTIRVFEALACGIPLICTPWEDCEGLFRPGEDFLQAASGREMTAAIRLLLADRHRAAVLAERGLETIRSRHTCGHRVDELLAICRSLRGAEPRPAAPTFIVEAVS
jgi:spore maturation protein CgeB